MLIVFSGDDVISSRNGYVSLKKDYQVKNYDIKEIKKETLVENFYDLKNNLNLFHKSTAFFIENLTARDKKSKLLSTILKEIANSKDIVLVDWENKRVSKLLFPKKTIIKEFKLKENIFLLLDACYPSNKKRFLNLLNQTSKNIDSSLIFFMLVKRIKLLMEIKVKKTVANIPSWMLYKLKKQASFWTMERLLNFYDHLFKIDFKTKTSTNPFDLKESIDILAYYLL